MKKTKLLSLLACTAIAAGLGITSCGENEEPPVVEGKTINLVVSGPADRAEFDASLFEDFKEWRKAEGDPNTYTFEQVAHGEDKVDSEITDWTTGPDVYAFASDKIQVLFKAGALAQLGGTYASFVEDNNTETTIQGATFNDQLYAFPYTGDNTYYLQYDKSIFTEEDVKSVEGILAKCAESGTKFYYKLQEGFYGAGAMFTWGADYNVKFTEDGQIESIEADFDGEKGLKAAKAIMKIASDPNWVDEYGTAGITEGCSIAVSGTWDIANIKGALGDNYACAPMPTVTVDGETEELGCFVGCKLFGVNPQRAGDDTDRLNAAYLLAQYLSGAEAQEKRFDELGIAPSNLTVGALSKVTSDENVATLVKQGEWGHAQGAVPGGIWNAPGVLVNGIKEGEITEENLQDAINAYNSSVEAAQ